MGRIGPDSWRVPRTRCAAYLRVIWEKALLLQTAADIERVRTELGLVEHQPLLSS